MVTIGVCDGCDVCVETVQTDGISEWLANGCKRMFNMASKVLRCFEPSPYSKIGATGQPVIGQLWKIQTTPYPSKAAIDAAWPQDVLRPFHLLNPCKGPVALNPFPHGVSHCFF